MKVEYLKRMDHIAKKAETREPEDVLESMGYVFMDPGSSIDGFIMKRKGTVYYGVNQGIKGIKYDFGVMHEGFHGLCRHYENPDFLSSSGAHMDCGSFLGYKNVAVTERDANIGAADFVIDTQDTLDMIGYDNADVAAYRADVESFEQHVRDYERHYELVLKNGSSENRISRMASYRKKLDKMFEELREQAQDIANSGICFTKSEIASHFGVPEYIIDYKFMALDLRGYDVMTIDLPSFSGVFANWR